MRIASLASLALLASAMAFCNLAAQAQSAPKPKFITLPNHQGFAAPHAGAAVALPQWNGSFTDQLGQTINFTMVGGDPAATNAVSKVRVYIIPIKMVFGPKNGNMTFDPLAVTLPKRPVPDSERFGFAPVFEGREIHAGWREGR